MAFRSRMRRFPSRRRSYSQKGRQGLWVNRFGFSPFQSEVNDPFTVEYAPLVQTQDWEREIQLDTRPKEKGGARLERLIFSAGGGFLVDVLNLVTFDVELAIIELNQEQTANPASPAGYSSRLLNHRVLHYQRKVIPQAPSTTTWIPPNGGATPVVLYTWQINCHIRPKTRLTDKQIVAYTMFTASTAAPSEIDSWTVSYSYRAYLSTP